MSIETSTLNDDTGLPDNGGALGGSNGALGGLNTADLKRGYANDPATPDATVFNTEDWMTPQWGGFAGRPTGYER